MSCLTKQWSCHRISTVKTHKMAIAAKERDVLVREGAVAQRESHLGAMLAQKDAEILSLQSMVSQLQEKLRAQCDVATIEQSIREAIARREEELRVAVMKREEEVAAAMARREEEIMHAIRLREEEIAEAWRAREEQLREEMVAVTQEREDWLEKRADELKLKEESLESVKRELETKIKALEQSAVRKGERSSAHHSTTSLNG